MDEMSALSWVGCGFLLSPRDSGCPYKTCSASPRYLGGQHSLYAFPHRCLQPPRTQNRGEDRDMRLAAGGRVGGTTFSCQEHPRGPNPRPQRGPSEPPGGGHHSPGTLGGGGAALPGDMGAVPKPGAGKGPAPAVGAGREVKGEGAAVPCRAVPGGAGRGEARRPRRVTRVPPGREAIAMETQARPRPRSRPCPPGEAVVVAAEAAAAGPGRSVEPGRASRG